MNIEEFLLARVEEAHQELSKMLETHVIEMAHYQQFEVTLHMQKELILWHRQWPILVEGPMEFEPGIDEVDVQSMTYRVTQQMAWISMAEYIKRFGIEAPAAPLLRRMAMFYTNHPDYNEEWRL